MRLAVVVPVLDEEAALPRTLESARAALLADDLLIVTDGGSADASVAIASSFGATVVTGSPGRGRQLERGAREALRLGAAALLFLHADTMLPASARERIADAIAAGAAGGGFLVRFDARGWRYRLGERVVNARTRRLRAPLGDQAQFATAAAFVATGGFPDWPILEDVELMRRLRRVGPLAVLDPPVLTSARRFERRGPARTVATNWLIWTLFRLGWSPQRLARFYYGKAR
jgi:rSAM/selenodomain-associated transferase 2